MIHAFSMGKPVIAPRFAMAEDYEAEGIIYIYDTDLNEMMRKAYSDKDDNCHKGQSAKDIMDKENSAELVLKELDNLLR